MMPRAAEHIERLMNSHRTFPFSLTNPTLIWGLSCMSITFFEPKMTFRNFLTFFIVFAFLGYQASHKKFWVGYLDLLIAILDGFQEWLFGFYFLHGLTFIVSLGVSANVQRLCHKISGKRLNLHRNCPSSNNKRTKYH
jgi:hypothetical protein